MPKVFSPQHLNNKKRLQLFFNRSPDGQETLDIGTLKPLYLYFVGLFSENFKDVTSSQTVKYLMFGRIWGDIQWTAMLLLTRFLMQ